jgi:IS5 family transposase
MGDHAYQGQAERIRQRAPQAADRSRQHCKSKLRVIHEVREENRIRSKTRSRVEHVFALLNLKFGFSKARYRGLAKASIGFSRPAPSSTYSPHATDCWKMPCTVPRKTTAD